MDSGKEPETKIILRGLGVDDFFSPFFNRTCRKQFLFWTWDSKHQWADYCQPLVTAVLSRNAKILNWLQLWKYQKQTKKGKYSLTGILHLKNKIRWTLGCLLFTITLRWFGGDSSQCPLDHIAMQGLQSWSFKQMLTSAMPLMTITQCVPAEWYSCFQRSYLFMPKLFPTVGVTLLNWVVWGERLLVRRDSPLWSITCKE